jgi:hypothetical protein
MMIPVVHKTLEMAANQNSEIPGAFFIFAAIMFSPLQMHFSTLLQKFLAVKIVEIIGCS